MPKKRQIERKGELTLLNVFGMRRSRLHLITECIRGGVSKYHFVNNFGGSPGDNGGKEGDFLMDKITKKYLNTEWKRNSVVLLEDKLYDLQSPMKIERNIIVIRDFYDVIISRVRCADRGSFARIDKTFVETYKKILREVLMIDNNIQKKFIIDTDKFISDDCYRNERLRELNIEGYQYKKNKIPIYGGGASFDKGESRDIEIPEPIQQLIKKDKELIDLIQQYHDYNILTKLN